MHRTWLVKTFLLVMIFLLAGCDMRLNPYSLETRAINLELGRKPVSFNEITFDARLGKVIVPAADSGLLALVDPVSGAPQPISIFTEKAAEGQQVTGVTSAAFVRGTIYALNPGARLIHVIDANLRVILNSVPVQEQPDIIRFVSATNELWVTEPAAKQIEVFSLNRNQPTLVEPSMTIPVEDGPEGLLINQALGFAFTNEPKNGTTAMIIVQTHNVINRWSNGCTNGRGLAMDEERGFLFVACKEGKLVLMDINNNGEQIDSINYGGGLDAVAYNPELQHVYLPSADSAILAVFAVSPPKVKTPTPGRARPNATPTPTPTPAPRLTFNRVGTADTAIQANCVTTDNTNIWVCDPKNGLLFMIKDTFPAGG